jgi:nitroreductase
MTSAALEFLMTRRSHPAKTLGPPVPGRDELRELLTAAARSPDHGKLEPWRFIVLQKPALDRLARLVVEIGQEAGRAEEDVEKQRRQYADADLAVAVVSSPRPSQKIPKFEQLLSAGAVCLSLLNAALASGWGANWLTGWAVYDPRFRAEALGLMSYEQVAGMIHIGTRTVLPQDRPRPDIEAITVWAEE